MATNDLSSQYSIKLLVPHILSKPLLILISCLFILPAAKATVTWTVDWTDVILSGSNPYAFNDSYLGLVKINYTDAEKQGIGAQFGNSEALILGNVEGESVTISWSKPIKAIDVRLWDVDSISSTGPHESAHIITTGEIIPVSLHSTDIWNASDQILTSDGSTNLNTNPNNCSILRIKSGSGLFSFTIDWADLNGSSGLLGIGDIDIHSKKQFPFPAGGPFSSDEPQMIELYNPPPAVLIPAGEYEMGDHFGLGEPDELPIHAVYIDELYMDKYEVTNNEYCTYLNSAYQKGLIEVTDGVVYKKIAANLTVIQQTVHLIVGYHGPEAILVLLQRKKTIQWLWFLGMELLLMQTGGVHKGDFHVVMIL